MKKCVNENELMRHRQELKAHCHELIDLIFRHRYGIKLLLAASKALEMIADYKANRNGNYVKKFPLTVQDADTLPTVVKE
jgi:hypothetical protein